MADESNANTNTSTAIIMEPTSSKPLHPLHEIAMTPTHKLLLKQWLKEEELILNRITAAMADLSSSSDGKTDLSLIVYHYSCSRSWVPSLCSLLCSLGLIWAVRYKTEVELHLEKMLKREKEDGNLLGKCVEELKKKGLDFDLLKEVDALRRAKSLKGENKSVKKWSGKDFVTMFFVAVSCFVLALMRVILCN
nr:keratinocyte proline-rich protein [Tanacetum cinerariifolium]